MSTVTKQIQVYSNNAYWTSSEVFHKMNVSRLFLATNWYLLLDSYDSWYDDIRMAIFLIVCSLSLCVYLCVCVCVCVCPWWNVIKKNIAINLKRSTPFSCYDYGNFQFPISFFSFTLLTAVHWFFISLTLIFKIYIQRINILPLPTSGLYFSTALVFFNTFWFFVLRCSHFSHSTHNHSMRIVNSTIKCNEWRWKIN